RAYFVAAAEKYNVYGMKGYADDGYCSEGVGYYNYGFRAYILLREEVYRATQGKIDFFQTPKFVRIARYGKKIQMNEGVCPAYSDCRMGLSPDRFILSYCDRALGIT
ncbi:glycoside hydrolase family 88 protein, partial [Klebsiella oxytoca]